MAKEAPPILPKSSFNPESQEKGEIGQRELQAWFDRNGFGYVAVCQAKETFARLFAGDVKRPDFLLVVDGLGMIAVDAKYREPLRIGTAYSLPFDGEFKKAIMFERIFRLPVWYAYRGQKPGEWLWISALKAFEVGQLAGKEGSNYLELKLDDFVVIRFGADFGRLYTQRLPGYRKLASRSSLDLLSFPSRKAIASAKKPTIRAVPAKSGNKKDRASHPSDISPGIE